MNESIINLITEHGFTSVLLAGIFGVLAYNYKEIINWMLATIQAAAIVKNHEATIQELKLEIESLRQKLEEYNKILIDQSETIGRLEERIIYNAKRKVNRKLEDGE